MSKPRSDKYYKFIWWLFRIPFKIFARIKYGIKRSHPIKLDSPALILCNHTTDADFSVVTQLISNHFYLVCSQHVVDEGLLGKIIGKYFNPITVHKDGKKTVQVIEMMKKLSAGNNVLLFPEGRLSHNGSTCEIDPSIAKLAKFSKCKLVTVRLTGGFFKQPRWQLYQNKGSLFDYRIANIYEPEYLKTASTDEIIAHIREDLHVDAYAEQKKVMQPFKLKHGVEGIQRFYCVCPKCGAVDTLAVSGTNIKCKCGFEMNYNRYGFFDENTANIATTAEWEKIQNAKFDEIIRNAGDGVIFSDDVVGLYVREDGKANRFVKNGNLVCYNDRLVFDGETFPFSDLTGLDILKGGSSIIFSKPDVNLELYKEDACLNKYYYTYLHCLKSKQ